MKPKTKTAGGWTVAIGSLLAMCDRPGPVRRGSLHRAILDVFHAAARDAAGTNMVGLSRPVWTGWMSAQSVLWRLPVELAERRFAHAPSGSRDFEAGCFVGEMCLELAEARELERRLTCPLKHNPDPEVAARQDWEFRLPGFNGCCYWEPSRPVVLTPESDWMDLVNERHRVLLLDNLGGDPADIPQYVLARIERYRLQNTGRASPRRVLLF